MEITGRQIGECVFTEWSSKPQRGAIFATKFVVLIDFEVKHVKNLRLSFTLDWKATRNFSAASNFFSSLLRKLLSRLRSASRPPQKSRFFVTLALIKISNTNNRLRRDSLNCRHQAQIGFFFLPNCLRAKKTWKNSQDYKIQRNLVNLPANIWLQQSVERKTF